MDIKRQQLLKDLHFSHEYFMGCLFKSRNLNIMRLFIKIGNLWVAIFRYLLILRHKYVFSRIYCRYCSKNNIYHIPRLKWSRAL